MIDRLKLPIFTHLIGQMTARAARMPWCASLWGNVRDTTRKCTDGSHTAIMGVFGEMIATRSPGRMPASRRAYAKF